MARGRRGSAPWVRTPRSDPLCAAEPALAVQQPQTEVLAGIPLASATSSSELSSKHLAVAFFCPRAAMFRGGGGGCGGCVSDMT